MESKFGEILLYLRTEKELSQRDLAKATNLSKSAISDWENNNRTPSLAALIILAEYFDVTIDYLVGLKDF